MYVNNFTAKEFHLTARVVCRYLFIYLFIYFNKLKDGGKCLLKNDSL